MRNDFKQPDTLLLCGRPVISAVILFALLPASRLDGENPDSLRWRRPTQSYEFDTGILFGCIEPYSWYHGVAGPATMNCYRGGKDLQCTLCLSG